MSKINMQVSKLSDKVNIDKQNKMSHPINQKVVSLYVF